jgi:hypothetical protein
MYTTPTIPMPAPPAVPLPKDNTTRNLLVGTGTIVAVLLFVLLGATLKTNPTTAPAAAPNAAQAPSATAPAGSDLTADPTLPTGWTASDVQSYESGFEGVALTGDNALTVTQATCIEQWVEGKFTAADVVAGAVTDDMVTIAAGACL